MDSSVRDRGLYAFGPFRLDPARRELSRDGEPLALTPTVFDTLLYLVENPGRVVSKEELLDAIWPRRVVEESNVSQTVFTLRRALGGGGDGERFILTAPGRGYRFAAPVRLEGAVAPAGEVITWPLPLRPARPRLSGVWRRRPLLSAAAVLAIVLAIGASVIAVAPWRVHHAPRARSLVVLADFQNLSGDPIFDRTLAKATEIDLDQSPFLNVLPEQRVEDTLVLMTRSRDERVTPALAREICERNNAASVVSGTLSAIGARYLLTLTATDCSGARVLAEEKAAVQGREAVVAALDRLIGRARGNLGESPRSVHDFDVPLLGERTASLAALKAYSEGSWLYDHGRRADSIPLFSHAVELDPNFAAAYAALSTVYAGFYESAPATDNITKAYALRALVGEREKLFIVSRYDEIVSKDLDAAIRNLQLSTEIYPGDASAWNNLADADDDLGRYAQEVDVADRALALAPGEERPYAVLARAWLEAGDADRAQAIATRAVSRGLAGEGVHEVLLLIAFTRGDAPAVGREIAWARGKPAERTVLVREDEIALGRGRVREADGWFERAVELSRRQGLPDNSRASRARNLVDLGLPEKARALLARDGGDANPDYLITMARLEAPAAAEALLAQALRRGPDDTLLNNVYAPQARAELALRRGQPRAAIAELQRALPYETCDFDVPYLLGSALLAAGDGPDAAAEFQKILDHQGWDPTSPLYPLARLGRARALRVGGDRAGSRRAYRTFLAAWKDADPDLPVLLAARREYATI